MAGEKYPKAKASAETEIETQKKWRIIVIIIRRHNWFGMRSKLKTLADPGAVENWISWGPHLMDGIGIGIGIGETQPSRRFHFAAARWNGDGKKRLRPKQNKWNEENFPTKRKINQMKWWRRRSHESQSQLSLKFISRIICLPGIAQTTRCFYNFRYKPTLLQICCCTALDEPRVTIWFYFYLCLCLCLMPDAWHIAHWTSSALKS